MAEGQSKRSRNIGDEFHMMVGYCIAEWAKVDNELFLIFRDCVGPYEQSAIIYYKTPGLDARFSLTDEIVRSVLPKPARKSGGHQHHSVKAWGTAIKGYQELLAARRRIAHHPVAIRMQPLVFSSVFNSATLGSVTISGAPSWYEIYVNQHERLRGKSSDLPALRADDLRCHFRSVGALGDRLHHFFDGVLRKFDAESPPPSPPPSSPKSQKEVLSKEPRHPPRPSRA
jgi:hypothetical protein